MAIKWGTKKTAASAFIFLAGVCSILYAKPKKPKTNLVKQEPGFYYGFGDGKSAEEAQLKAKLDLVENSLTATIRQTTPSAEQVSVSADALEKRLPKIKVFNQSKDGLTVAYRIKIEDWNKEENSFAENLRNELEPSYKILSSRGKLAERIKASEKILNTLADNGETMLLSFQDGGTDLYSAKVQKEVTKLLNDLEFSFSVKDKIVKQSDRIVLSVKDSSGSPSSDLNLKAVWISPSAEDLEEVQKISTNSFGEAEIEFPSSEGLINRPVSLEISAAFHSGKIASSVMKKLSNVLDVEARYFFTDKDEMFEFVTVEGGKFSTGGMKHDTKAFSSREKARTAELETFEIAKTPVSNFQYGVYLFLNRIEELPEYFENPDYCDENQPVIAVSADQAEAFAAWLSGETGNKYRLPSDDEWEVAARGGQEVIYAWGDDDPSKKKNANYKGNGRFKYPSPAGSFEGGINAIGLEDMCGNVWEWTSSARNAEEDSDVRTVKGGSWMDGPADLRISNYKNINKDECLPDVGFRLVKEIKK